MLTFQKFNLDDFANSFVVADKTVLELYGFDKSKVFALPAGEQTKCFATVEALCRAFLQNNLTKNSQIVAVGGGSIGDVVGFAASVYKRGTRLLHVPTTLLSMIDSSIGGKTALNLDGVKNAVGTIFSADTLIDFDFLQTLNESHFSDALGEIEKYRLLSKEIDLAVKAGDTKQLVKSCANFKQSVVEQDFFDSDFRQQLNMGHTVGHALELTYNLSHGKAVLLGLFFEMQIAVHLQLLNKSVFEDFASRLKLNREKTPLTQEVIKCMQADKKNIQQKICFVLPTGDYGFTKVNLTPAEVKKIFSIC